MEIGNGSESPKKIFSCVSPKNKPKCGLFALTKREREVLYTHQAFVLVADQVLIFTVSAKAVHRARVDSVVEGLMNSLEFRELP